MERFIKRINTRFNALPLRRRRAIALAAGCAFAAACTALIIKSILL